MLLLVAQETRCWYRSGLAETNHKVTFTAHGCLITALDLLLKPDFTPKLLKHLCECDPNKNEISRTILCCQIDEVAYI